MNNSFCQTNLSIRISKEISWSIKLNINVIKCNASGYLKDCFQNEDILTYYTGKPPPPPPPPPKKKKETLTRAWSSICNNIVIISILVYHINTHSCSAPNYWLYVQEPIILWEPGADKLSGWVEGKTGEIGARGSLLDGHQAK